MLRNLFVLTLTVVSAASAVFAQQTMTVPVPPSAVRQAFVFDGGSNSYLGIQTQEVTKDNFGKFGLREVRGAAVDKVSENSPAAQAGLQKGDVILKFNGEEISSTRKLSRLITETAPDHQAVLTVSRGGAEREITVTLAKRQMPALPEMLGNGTFNFPSLPNTPEVFTFPRGSQSSGTLVLPTPPNAQIAPGADGNFLFFRSDSSQIGISTTVLTKQLADYFGVANGVLISSVRENSPAAKAGLKAGDIIVEADGGKIVNAADLTKAFGAKKEGDVNLTIIRDKNRQTVQVTPEAIKN